MADEIATNTGWGIATLTTAGMIATSLFAWLTKRDQLQTDVEAKRIAAETSAETVAAGERIKALQAEVTELSERLDAESLREAKLEAKLIEQESKCRAEMLEMRMSYQKQIDRLNERLDYFVSRSCPAGDPAGCPLRHSGEKKDGDK